MADRGSADTTARADDTAHPPNRYDSIVLKWVFPDELAGGIRVGKGGLSLGRGVECAFRLDAASVSRMHCEIYRDGPVFAVRDVGSTNGTHLNGSRVEHAALACGDVLRVGDAIALVEPADATLDPAGIEELAPNLFGGPQLSRLVEPLRRAATSALPIVLVGETGTGKERIANAIHDFSGRPHGFHAINCAALPKDLAESELFGFRKGAFTGAERAYAGRLRAARGGTLLLDEIADLPLAIQAKLLRVIEQREITPLGDDVTVPFEARIVAATQRPLEELVAEGTFRRDLRARLAGLSVEIPPLHRRREDILPLFEHFLRVHSGGRAPALESKLAEALLLQAWPDNVRELELVARGLLALHGTEPILKRSFLADVQRRASNTPARDTPERAFSNRKDHDLHHFVVALRQTEGNVAAAAAALGFSRQRAYRLMAGRSAADLLATEEALPRKKGENGSHLE